MRAQVTVEYLLLSVVALSLIAFSIVALAHIRDSAAKAQAVFEFKSSATDLANAINEACALGYGNSRLVYLKREMAVTGGGGSRLYYAKFTDADSSLSLSKETFCEVVDAAGLFGKVEVKNENGKITAEKSK